MTVNQIKEELTRHGVQFQNKLQKPGLVKLVMDLPADKPPPKKQATSSPGGLRAKTAGYQVPSKSDTNKIKQRGTFPNGYAKSNNIAVLEELAALRAELNDKKAGNVEEKNKNPTPQESNPPPPPPTNPNTNLKEGEMAIKMADYVAQQAELMALRPQVATLLGEKKALEEKVALLQGKQEEWMKTGMGLVERANKIAKGMSATPITAASKEDAAANNLR
jgi:hypothetical protein